jgi:hypothetical protein
MYLLCKRSTSCLEFVCLVKRFSSSFETDQIRPSVIIFLILYLYK